MMLHNNENLLNAERGGAGVVRVTILRLRLVPDPELDTFDVRFSRPDGGETTHIIGSEGQLESFLAGVRANSAASGERLEIGEIPTVPSNNQYAVTS